MLSFQVSWIEVSKRLDVILEISASACAVRVGACELDKGQVGKMERGPHGIVVGPTMYTRVSTSTWMLEYSW